MLILPVRHTFSFLLDKLDFTMQNMQYVDPWITTEKNCHLAPWAPATAPWKRQGEK